MSELVENLNEALSTENASVDSALLHKSDIHQYDLKYDILSP
jgi:hypothetical protein